MENVILIVEDCSETVAALEIALQQHFSCRVEHASDGAEALRALGRLSPSLFAVVTDLNLPEIDGWNVIAQLRQRTDGSKTPVIAISADPDPQAGARALEAGADAFIGKPYSPLAVCQCLENILHARK